MPSRDPFRSPVRMIDVAREAGVSRATVSLVMRENHLAAPRTREHVLAVAKRLGYVYDRRAAQLRSGRSNVVGLIITDSRNPFFMEFTDALEAQLAASEKVLLVSFTHDDLDIQKRIIQRFIEDRVSDVILVPAIGTTPEAVSKLCVGANVVLATRRLIGVDLPYVGSDAQYGSRAAADHLLWHGCRRLAYFGGLGASPTRADRSVGFASAVAEAGGELVAPWSVASEPDAERVFEQTTRLVRSGDLPDGIACNSDAIAFGVMRALADHGVEIGKEVRVIGFDDLVYSKLWRPSLTSIRVEPDALGELAAAAILRGEREGILHRPVLISRESCGCG
ncbi:substrate-binding domain-containing protein [Tessaracoccus antarcticus]|uniref:LacI family transcriptional regulator n=1 Tax=Tessaracoccus antarcticus TaxID=2479848 RepID=A0A3M0FZ84_9ACTN|nr:substrate-binding domain-containing protein [Tessaracoccus antarcticus]RMB57227.1 LacI family transcriptional regulator [Tessaracoccus antarcticus]